MCRKNGPYSPPQVGKALTISAMLAPARRSAPSGQCAKSRRRFHVNFVRHSYSIRPLKRDTNARNQRMPSALRSCSAQANSSGACVGAQHGQKDEREPSRVEETPQPPGRVTEGCAHGGGAADSVRHSDRPGATAKRGMGRRDTHQV